MNTESIIQPDPEIKGERGPAMKGADVLVAALEREGVDTILAYPGGASMELHQALTSLRKIRTILPRQEQGGGFMAHADTPGQLVVQGFAWQHPVREQPIWSHVLPMLTWTVFQ